MSAKTDITYIPVQRGFLYLVAIMCWASRHVLAWRLSNTLDAGFCTDALEEALARYGVPEIFNTDHGSQFTSFAFTGRLREASILGVADDSDVTLRFPHRGNGLRHERGDVLRQSVQRVAWVMARELAEGEAVGTETGFKGHLPALPPARQIANLGPAGHDDLLRNLVGNGTHRVLSVVVVSGAHPSTREHNGASFARR